MSQNVSTSLDNKSLPNDTVKDTSKKSSTFSMNRVLLKAKYSLYSALIFFLFANPETSIVLQKIFGKLITFVSPSGMRTIEGLFMNTGFFFLTMLGLMLLPSE